MRRLEKTAKQGTSMICTPPIIAVVKSNGGGGGCGSIVVKALRY
jgi:hypothetical protein